MVAGLLLTLGLAQARATISGRLSGISLSVSAPERRGVEFRFKVDEQVQLTPSQGIERCHLLAIEAEA